MPAKRLFLVRHAAYSRGGQDPSLSESGKEQALQLARRILQVTAEEYVTLWTSPALRAKETADILASEIQSSTLIIKDLLWSDNKHPHDFDWLRAELSGFSGGTLIVVTHLEYVRYFPDTLGFGENSAQYAEGVMIESEQCVLFR